MVERVEMRAAYGRSIRERALCMLDAHGVEAWAEARRAAGEPGLGAGERSFWEAVAARIARQLGHREGLPAA
jgi:hypothetical protein